MNRIAAGLSGLVRRFPAVVLVGMLLLTGVFATFAAQVESAPGNEGFAPDNPQIDAMETIGESFNASSDSVVQILVRGDEVLSADGLAAVAAVTEAVTDSAGGYLVDRPEQPAVLAWTLGMEQALAEQGIDPTTADDETVRETFAALRERMPAEEAEFVTGLLPDDAAEGPTTAGLVVVLLDTDEIVPADAGTTETWDAIIDVETRLAEAARAADLPAGFSAESFSFPLLFADDDAFMSELARLFTSAFVIIIVILGFVYWLKPGLGLTWVGAGRRTVADILLTMATIVMAILWMNGAAALLGPGYADVIGPMTEITQIVPVLLIGLGVDYAIHLTSRYREEAARGLAVREAIGRAVNTVGVALVLATVTTAVGFLTNIVNPVPALQDFGVLAAVGIVASFLLMLTFVPSVRLLLDRRAEGLGRLPRPALGRTSERVLPGIMARTAVFAERAPVATVMVTVVVGGALGTWGLASLETRFSVTDFVSDESPVVQTLDEIVERFGGGFGETTNVLVSGDVATAETHNALAQAHADLVDVPDVAAFGDQPQAESPVAVLGMLLAPTADGSPPPLAEAAAAAGVDEDLTVDDDADVAVLYDAMFEAAPEAADRVLARDGAGTFEHAVVRMQTTAGEAGAGQLEENLLAVFAPVAGTGVTVTPTSDEIINEAIVEALSDSQVSSMIITLAAAMLLLTVTFWIQNRRPLLGVLTVAPVVLVVLWTFGMMAATGIPFGPVTATIAALAIGIGVPYMIHITNRFQEDRLLCATPQEAIRSTVRHTGGALAGSAFTTCAGFGILVTSTLTPFRQFGLVTVYAIGFALLAATLVLPSMLALWDRWYRRPEELGPPETTPVREPLGA